MTAVNLLNGQLTHRAPARTRLVRVALALLVCGSASALTGAYWLHLRYARQAAHLEHVALRAEAALARGGAEHAAALDERSTEIARRLHAAFELEAAAASALDALIALSRAVPESVWLLEVDARAPGLGISGRAKRPDAVPELVDRLRETGTLGSRVDVETKTAGGDRSEVVEFRVRVGEE